MCSVDLHHRNSQDTNIYAFAHRDKAKEGSGSPGGSLLFEFAKKVVAEQKAPQKAKKTTDRSVLFDQAVKFCIANGGQEALEAVQVCVKHAV